MAYQPAPAALPPRCPCGNYSNPNFEDVLCNACKNAPAPQALAQPVRPAVSKKRGLAGFLSESLFPPPPSVDATRGIATYPVKNYLVEPMKIDIVTFSEFEGKVPQEEIQRTVAAVNVILKEHGPKCQIVVYVGSAMLLIVGGVFVGLLAAGCGMLYLNHRKTKAMQLVRAFLQEENAKPVYADRGTRWEVTRRGIEMVYTGWEFVDMVPLVDAAPTPACDLPPAPQPAGVLPPAPHPACVLPPPPPMYAFEHPSSTAAADSHATGLVLKGPEQPPHAYQYRAHQTPHLGIPPVASVTYPLPTAVNVPPPLAVRPAPPPTPSMTESDLANLSYEEQLALALLQSEVSR